MNEEPIWPETPRSIVIERLKEYAPRLSKTCRKEGNHAFDWPDSHLLGRVSQCVAILVGHERKIEHWRRSGWENINILDKRIRSLRLVQRINGLIKRAIEKREELCGESVLEKAARNPDSVETQMLLRDFLQQKGKLAGAVKDHESRLWHRWQSLPLFWWVCEMEHPDAKQLALSHIESPTEAQPIDYSQDREAIKRWNARKRQQRFRQRKKSPLEKRYV
jgi:hypothetical protein